MCVHYARMVQNYLIRHKEYRKPSWWKEIPGEKHSATWGTLFFLNERNRTLWRQCLCFPSCLTCFPCSTPNNFHSCHRLWQKKETWWAANSLSFTERHLWKKALILLQHNLWLPQRQYLSLGLRAKKSGFQMTFLNHFPASKTFELLISQSQGEEIGRWRRRGWGIEIHSFIHCQINIFEHPCVVHVISMDLVLLCTGASQFQSENNPKCNFWIWPQNEKKRNTGILEEKRW